MKNILKVVVFGLSVVCMSSYAFAVGTVNMGAILQHSPETSKIQSTLKSHFSGEQKKLQAQALSLQSALQKYEKNKAVMSKAQLATTKSSLQKQEIALQQGKQKFQQEVAAMQMKLSKKMFEDVKASIQKVAKSQKLDLVMPSTVVLYAGKTVDITNQVMSGLK